MKIGFDAKRLFLNDTGLGNYSRTLVRNLQYYFPEHQYFLFTPRITRNKDTAYFLDKPDFQIITPDKNSIFWRQWGINSDIANLRLDVFHGLSHELPFGQKNLYTRYFISFHDLIFDLFPNYYPFIDRKLYTYKYKISCNKADHIIAISRSTAKDLNRVWGVSKNKVTTIYQSCNPEFSEKEWSKSLKKHFLYVGSITKRKNLLVAIKALSLLPSNIRKPLIVIGEGGRYKEKVLELIEELNLSSWVHFKGQIDNSELVNYYDAAIALIYPSEYEGFGIPIIEAAHRKIPVITTLSSSMPEAGGPHIFYTNPGDVVEIQKHMLWILNHPEELKIRINDTYDYVRTTFDPFKLSQKLINLYQSIV